MNVKIQITETGMKNIEAFLRECKAKRKELLDASKDTAENVEIPVYADIAEAIEPTEDGIWTETFNVTDNSDLTIRLDESVDFTVMLI